MSTTSNVAPPGTDGEGQSKQRPNPVALEVMVNVTGARPGGGEDLFSEDAQTVMVFRDGAIIRLSAAVSVGQLVFLTLKKTNREVVCQVLHKRNFKPTMCYVELQFIEETPDYWGVSFPEAGSGAGELRVAKEVEEQEPTEDDPGTGHPVKELDPEALHKEAEALRQQLIEIANKKAQQEATEAAAEAEEAWKASAQQTVVKTKPAEKPEEAPAAFTFSNTKLELANVNDQNPDLQTAAVAGEPKKEEPKTAPLLPAAETGGLKRPVIGMSLPGAKKESRMAETLAAPAKPNAAPGGKPVPLKDPDEALLPQTDLDFSKAPQLVSALYLDENDPRSIYRPKTKGLGKGAAIGLCAVVVLGAAIGGWEWNKGRSQSKLSAKGAPTIPESTKSAPVTAAVPNPPAVATAKGAPVGDSPVAGKGQDWDPMKNFRIVQPGEEKPAEEKPAAEGKTADPELAEKSPEVKPKEVPTKVKAAKNKNAGVQSVTFEPSIAESVATDAPVTEAKLLKEANPVYPPAAMRNYITGDVRAEAVVKPDGSVGDVKVLSGPKQFYDPAIEALKQYHYAPAMQGGKPVASRVRVTVKFWFNP